MISEGPVIELDDSEVQTSMINYMYISCIPLNCNYWTSCNKDVEKFQVSEDMISQGPEIELEDSKVLFSVISSILY